MSTTEERLPRVVSVMRIRVIRHWIDANTFTPNWWPAITRHPAAGYLVAALLQMVATVVTLALIAASPALAFPSALSLLAIAVIALTWGAGPSLLATLLGFALFVTIAVPRHAPVDVLSLLLFLVVGGGISAVGSRSERLRRVANAARVDALEHARELDQTVEQAAVGIAHVGLDGRWLRVNQMLCDIVGYSRDELLQRTFQEVTHPADRAADLASVSRLLAGEIPHYSLEKRYLRPDQVAVWIRVTVSLLRSGSGAPQYFISVIEDITARLEAQRRLADATALLTDSLDDEAALADVAGAAVPYLADWCLTAVVEPDGGIRRLGGRHADPARQEILHELARRSLPATASLGVAQVLQTHEPELYVHVPEDLVAAIAGDAENHGLVRQLGIASAMIVPLVARGRTLGALTFVVADVDRRYGPADLAVAQDLAGRAALAVDNARLYRAARDAVQVRDDFVLAASHDLRTPLTTIRGYADLIMMRLQGNRPLDAVWLREKVGALHDGVVRLSAAVEAITDVAHLQMGQPVRLHQELVEVGALTLAVARQIAGAETQERARVEVVAPSPDVTVLGDRVRLERVLQNIIGNAVTYSPERTAVLVTVEGQSEWVRITVRDRGVGIPSAELPHIFKRFYRASTAQSIKGTGVGLAGSKSLVEQHGGHITIESAVGVGTTVVVTLPLASGAGR